MLYGSARGCAWTFRTRGRKQQLQAFHDAANLSVCSFNQGPKDNEVPAIIPIRCVHDHYVQLTAAWTYLIFK